jgi:small subunit ribosomal protein S16
MVKIRLTRVGRKKHPAYRIVVADSRAARDGRYIELLGWYQPLNKEKAFELNGEKALHWLKQGALPSDTVKSLLRQTGVMKDFHAHKVELAAQRKARKKPSTEQTDTAEPEASVADAEPETPADDETAASSEEAQPEAPVEPEVTAAPEASVEPEEEQPAAPAQ